MVEPNRVTDDVGRKSVTLTSIHHRIIDQQQLTCQHHFVCSLATKNVENWLQLVGPLLQRRAHLPSNLETVRLHYGWHVTRLPNQCYHRDLLAV